MSNFDNDPRRKQELRGRQIADRIYYRNWGDIFIKRYDQGDNLVLDQQFAIDITVTMPNGMKLNGQEKFLSYKYASFETLTIEYLQNPQTNEQGDWFKLASQFYLSAYFTEDNSDFIKYVLIDWPMLVLFSNNGEARWYDNHNKDGRARASFRYIYFKDIPKECIIDIKP